MKFWKILGTVGAFATLFGACGSEEELKTCKANSRFFNADIECTCPNKTATVTSMLDTGTMNFNSAGTSSAGVFVQSFKGGGRNAKEVALKIHKNLANVTLSKIEISIRKDCGGNPCSDPIVSGSLSGDALTTTQIEHTISLDDRRLLAYDVTYYLYMRFIDLNGQITFASDNDTYEDGFARWSNDTGETWTLREDVDFYFKILTCDD